MLLNEAAKIGKLVRWRNKTFRLKLKKAGIKYPGLQYKYEELID
jgi:hypothetical protein